MDKHSYTMEKHSYMVEKYSYYEFCLKHDNEENAWYYEIYDPDFRTRLVLRDANDWFDTEQEARFAAIGHIDLLENGEG